MKTVDEAKTDSPVKKLDWNLIAAYIDRSKERARQLVRKFEARARREEVHG